MQTLTLAFAVVTLLIGFALAGRLLHLAARTRKAPELAMGIYCLLVTVGAVLYGVAFGRGPAHAPDSVAWISAASTLLIGLAAFALAIGIWQIFHAGHRFGPAAVVAVGLWIAGGWVASVLPGRPVLLGDFTLPNAIFIAGRVAVYGFGAFEAFRYARMLRRRAVLGLGDPIAAHQMGLWGTAWICVALVGVCSFVIIGVAGAEAFERPAAPLLVSALNAAAWVCTWLAFFPPAAYQRWIEGAAAEASA